METNLDPKDYPMTFKCERCGHEQTVVPASVWHDGKILRGIFGSAADFCEKCDGPVEPLEN